MENGTRLAAIDLGSNSFRLEIARFDFGQIHRTEYLKETVRQGNGLDENHYLSVDAMQRGWDCLARFAERLAGFKQEHVRAVATQTLREAKNRQVFIDRAQIILGFPIDVVSGREEARLIYQGVSHLLPQSPERRLVIDIGGRSTELILGQDLEAREMGSYRIGSVDWSQTYFADGKLSANAFKKAEIAAKALLGEVTSLYAKTSWDTAYGSSGTVGAVSDVLETAGWPAGIVTREGLDWLVEKLCKTGHTGKLKLLGLKDERRTVIAGGVCILRALFELLNIEQLHMAQGALRHGALYELIERDLNGSDLRSASVTRLAKIFQIEPVQAHRVSATAEHLLNLLLPSLPLKDFNSERLQKKLRWAAQLHEIGCLISHESPHKHGAYILSHADAEGFALAELERLSMLILGQRGKLKKLGECLNDRLFTAQLLCLRLAIIFCHARGDVNLMGVDIFFSGKGRNCFLLTFPNRWLNELPQTIYLLHEEINSWEKAEVGFSFFAESK